MSVKEKPARDCAWIDTVSLLEELEAGERFTVGDIETDASKETVRTVLHSMHEDLEWVARPSERVWAVGDEF